jgi:hypothetical protein
MRTLMESHRDPRRRWPNPRLSTFTVDDFKPRGEASPMAETAAAALRAKRGKAKKQQPGEGRQKKRRAA